MIFDDIFGSNFGSNFCSNFAGCNSQNYYTSFGSKSGQPLSTLVSSRIVKLKTIPINSAITISGGYYQINNGTWLNAAGTLDPTDTVKLRVTSSGEYLTETSCTAMIDNVAYPFTVTTAAEAGNFLYIDNTLLTVNSNTLNIIN